jgi:hypothetical protein
MQIFGSVQKTVSAEKNTLRFDNFWKAIVSTQVH